MTADTLTFSEDVTRKGQTIVDDGRIYHVAGWDDGGWLRFTVAGGSGGYIVAISPDRTEASCTCPHGQHHRTATCSHVAAALLMGRP